jgi:hypothetical protein
MPAPLRRLRRSVRQGPSDAPGRVVDVLGRVGLVGYGVVHLVVAWLALHIAFGIPTAPADAQGAVGTIARSGVGSAVLAVGVLGLVSFAVWQLTAAALGFRWTRGRERFRKRAGAVAKAIAVTALAALVVDYLVGKDSTRETPAQTVAAGLLALPAGRLLLGAAACAVLGLAAAMTYTGIRRTFMGDLDLHRLGSLGRRLVAGVGAVGHLARAAALAVVGLLAMGAAVSADPDRAGGLDAALRALGKTAAGAALLVVVATGFAAYGVFCFVDAATRRA